MDLQSLQYQMLLAVQKHQLLMGKRKLEPENGSLKKEILEVLCQLIDINEKQKSVVSQLRAEREAFQQQQHQQQLSGSYEDAVSDCDLQCAEQMLQESVGLADLSVASLPRPGVNHVKSHHDTAVNNITSHLNTAMTAQSLPPQSNGQPSTAAKPVGTSSPRHCNTQDNASNLYTHNSQRKQQDRLLELQEFRKQGRRVSPQGHSSSLYEKVERECPQVSQPRQNMSSFIGQDLGQPTDKWGSPEKRLSHFSPPPAEYTIEDVHDLVTAEEFMNAIGLLTVRECDEVMRKRHERRKRNQNRHIFSLTLWEKPEKRRKRRDWLAAAVGSPPNLRNKPRPVSEVPKGIQSGPPSPLQSSCSPPASQLSSQPPSPASTENDTPTPTPPSSEEICPICKIKGADVLCEGCGVIYHGACVDLGSNCAPTGWLCLTCEQLGLRATGSTFNVARAPQHLSSRREMLMAREELLHQRASLTIDKLQLEERKQFLSKALAIQTKERKELENKEHNVQEAIHKLKSFIATFQKSPPQCPIQAATSSPSTQPHTVTHSKSSSHSPSGMCRESNPPSTSSPRKLYPAAANTLLHSKQQKSFYVASNSCSVSSASFPTSTKVVSSPSLLHCSTFSSFPAFTKASSNKTTTLTASPLLSSLSSSRLSRPQQAYSPPTLSHPRPASPSIGRASYPHGSPSPGPRSYSQRTSSPGPPSYPHINLSPEPARHTNHSQPLGPATSYPHGSPSPELAYSYSRISSSLGQASNSPQDLTLYPADSPPVSHLRPGTNPPAISRSNDEGLESPYTNSQSIKFPCKRKLGISESVFHDHKNCLATHMRNESDVMMASS